MLSTFPRRHPLRAEETRSTVENASVHVRRRYLINFDLSSFYDHIHFSRITGILQSARYGLAPEVATAVAQIACFNRTLATGAATSGMISNIVAGPLDSALLRFAKRHGLRYTRYVDDITLSAHTRQRADVCLAERSEGEHFRSGEGVLSPAIVQIVHSQGFAVNATKVFFSSRAARQQVTNITVNEKPNIPRRMVSSVRGALHAIETFGLEKAQERYLQQHRPSANAGNSLAQRLKGQLLYIGQVTQRGAVYRRLAQRANAAVPELRLPVGASDGELATVVAEYDKSQASAFHLGGGYFITAAHAFPEGVVVAFHDASGAHHFTGTEVERDQRVDFAVYRTSDAWAAGLPSLSLSLRPLMVGDTVRAVGFPNYSIGNSVSVIDTSVIGHSTRMMYRRLDMAHRLEHGASGGPVLSMSGRVVGLVHGGPEHEDDSPAANSVTPTSKLIERLRPYTSAPSAHAGAATVLPTEPPHLPDLV